MKKIILLIFAIMLLCGCENDQSEYLVSSMGFDYDGEMYEVCFEAIVVNSENTDQTLKLFRGKGETAEEAVSQITKQCTRPLLLSHCGVIAVGEKIGKEQFLEVCDFCYKCEEITLSAFFINTKDAQELLSGKPLASACVGYDIMGLLKQNKLYKNRFFEVIKSGYETRLPTVYRKQGGIYFDG